MNIILTGFMAAGKTYAGKRLAKLLKIDFFDTDEVISLQEKMSVSEIFAFNGESYFRKLERDIFEKLLNNDSDKVISTGGGLGICHSNRKLLMQNETIFLNTDFSIIKNRLNKSGKSRPLIIGLSEDEIEKLWLKRCEIYKKSCKQVANSYNELLTYVKTKFKITGCST